MGLGLFVALMIPTSALAADPTTPISPMGAGEWDSKGSESVYIYPNCNLNTITNFNSQGGDFQVRMRDVTSANSYTVSIWEYDPDGKDVQIGSKYRKTGNADITWDVRGYGDGSDGDAEIYVKLESAYTSDTVTVYAYD